MKLQSKTLTLLACFSMIAALAACAGETDGHQDVPIDPAADDMAADDTVSPDLPDGTHDPDVIIDPTPDPTPDLDATEIRPDTTDTIADDAGCTVGVTGDPCSSATQCNCVPSSARECLTTLSGYVSFPGGYCSARCTSPADCGTGANCAEITTGTRYCLKVCSSASQCRMAEGYTCATIPMSSDTRTYCLPNMTTDGTGG
jgi:hypothetical protein